MQCETWIRCWGEEEHRGNTAVVQRRWDSWFTYWHGTHIDALVLTAAPWLCERLTLGKLREGRA